MLNKIPACAGMNLQMNKRSMAMRDNITIGLVSPQSTDRVPTTGPQMYPGVKFIAKGVGVKALTPEGYDSAWDGIVPAAEELAMQNRLDAIMVIGTSLTFYRGFEAHEKLMERLRQIGLPVSTMSSAVVEGLRALGVKKIAVSTAYADEVNRRLRVFLTDSGFEVRALEGFGLERFGAAAEKTEDDIIALAGRVSASARDAQGMLISCGGLRTLQIGKTIEDKYGLPVVSSTPAAFWAAMRLVGESGKLPGYGKLFETAH
jgi:arylmalonate decarboxylase